MATTNTTIEALAGVRYHGSVKRALGLAVVERVREDGTLDVHVYRPDHVDPWYPLGFHLRRVRAASVTLLGGVDYGDEPGVVDLFGAGQLALVGV